jgi:hypothetical protein
VFSRKYLSPLNRHIRIHIHTYIHKDGNVTSFPHQLKEFVGTLMEEPCDVLIVALGKVIYACVLLPILKTVLWCPFEICLQTFHAENRGS